MEKWKENPKFDSYYLDSFLKKLRPRILLFGIITVTGLMMFTLGLYFTTQFLSELAVLMLLFGIFASAGGIVALIATIPFLAMKVKKLLINSEEDELYDIAFNSLYNNHIAVYALLDFNPDRIKSALPLISENYSERFYIHIKKLLDREESMEIEEKSFVDKEQRDFEIPTEVVYFISSEKALENCMISKTQLAFDYEIVICPKCGGMAKKQLLEEWLVENSICPTCKRELKISECPTVDVKEVNR